MKCPNCNGRGEVHKEFVIPLWHGAEKDYSVLFTDVAYGKYEDCDAIVLCAQEFHELLTAHSHGVFHDTLRDCFKQD